MIKFKCMCGEQFRISEENMLQKDAVRCPNCDADLPSDVVEPLKAYAEHCIKANEALMQAEKKARETEDQNLGIPQDWIICSED